MGGCQDAKQKIREMLYHRRDHGMEIDLVQTVYWSAESDCIRFWWTLTDAAKAWKNKEFGGLGCDFRLAMEIVKGLYWYQYGTKGWESQTEKDRDFGVKCLDYYCETIELQQEAIFLFLLLWNKATRVKGPGRMIAKMVWEERYDCLVKKFGE